MKISEAIENLERIKSAQGDIEVTVTGCLLPDGYSLTDCKNIPDVFETTLENFVVTRDSSSLGTRVRLYL